MSQGTDRIPVPTNGKRPHPVDRLAQDADMPVLDPDAPVTEPLSTLNVSPAQLAVGFAILASLALLLVGRLRRRSRRR